MRYVVSFLKSPLGFLVNVVCTLTYRLPVPAWIDRPMCAAVEMFCLKDGIQDDVMF